MPPSFPLKRSVACLLALMANIWARPPSDAVVVFNEVLYNPQGASEAGEWIELHNQMAVNIDLSGWEITGGVNYTFPNGTVIVGKGFLLVAATPGLVPGSIGPWAGSLDNGGETVALRDRNRRLMDELSYNDEPPWPLSPDGTGHTLAKTSEDEASFDSANWTASAQMNGTPGAANFPGGLVSPTIVLHELAATGSAAGTFFIEIANKSAGSINLGGYVLVGDGLHQKTLSGTLAAGALLSLDETTLGFRLVDGEVVQLYQNSIGPVIDSLTASLSPQARDGQGQWQVPDNPTPGTANTFSISSAIVINEIMYHHIPSYLPTGTVEDPEQWVELLNRTGSPVTLTGWRLSGGISFSFPPGTQILPGQFLVVAKNAPVLLARFPGISAIGNFSGSLSHHDDVVRVRDDKGNVVDEVHYYQDGRWDDRADGDGSSLELRHPDADNAIPESWAASNESAGSAWQTITYQGPGTNPNGSISPTQWNEFACGLLGAGEFLLDDVSVREVTAGNRQLIQDGNFTDGSASEWRLLGTHGAHGKSGLQPDPSAPSDNVLHIVATDETEPIHNHVETTLKSGASFVALSDSATYEISFRARWISGSPRLSTRLYYNRLSRQTILSVPVKNGTPGAANSSLVSNPGPVFDNLKQSPVLPAAGMPVSIRVDVGDPSGVVSPVLKWRTDGTPWQDVSMSLTGSVAQGEIPAQAAGTLVQFYVQAADTLGAVSTYPTAGVNSRALVKWLDATNPSGPGHEFRLLMLASDATDLHDTYNAASNLYRPCTVIYKEKEIFHDAEIRLRSSLFGRTASPRLGFAVKFDPMHAFRGNYEGVNLDRSGFGRGTDGSQKGISEMINWVMFNRAGGVPSMYNDLTSLLAPRSTENGPAILTLAEFNDTYLDSQYENGSKGPVFRYDRSYFPTTATGGVEGPKPANPNSNTKVSLRSIDAPSDKEAYRWNFPITNSRRDDDYARMINLNQTFRMTGQPYIDALPQAIDLDQWMRVSAAMSLAGIGDNYATDLFGFYRQNLKLYARADGRMIYLPWDTDFLSDPTNAPLVQNFDLQKMVDADPRWERMFYGHMQDIIATSFNQTYLGSWVAHYQTFSPAGTWNEIIPYTNARIAYAQGEIAAKFPAVSFAITTNGGNGFASAGPLVTLAGDGWIDVYSIRLSGSPETLVVLWTDKDSWQVQVPIHAGSNPITLEALNYQGGVVGSDTLTIIGTGGAAPASATNIVVSELHYNPAALTAGEISAGMTDAQDFEYVELRNISSGTVDMVGCKFSDGIVYNFPSVQIPAGDCLVVPRRTSAFALRHPGLSTVAQYYVAGSNFFSNGGETVVLSDAGGNDIQRFQYSGTAPWPVTPKGQGPSLVLIAPQTNPDPNNPLNWRASRTLHGNPCTSDALFPVNNPFGDDDGDGISNLLERSLPQGVTVTVDPNNPTNVEIALTRQSWLDARVTVEESNDLQTWGALSAIGLTRTNLANGLELIKFALGADGTRFYRGRAQVQP